MTNPIQEKIERTEIKIAKVIPTETQKQYVEKYLEAINSQLDECSEFVEILYSNHYDMDMTAISTRNNISLAKEGLGHANDQTLYSLHNTLGNLNNLYSLPVQCDKILSDTADAIYGKHQLFQYTTGNPSMYSDTFEKMMAIGIDSTTEVTIEL